jgi:nicotinate-nucleotide adenylyltransferase
MRLGIFGGTFDPVHYGHLLLAESCREQARLDRVWFLPAAVPPHKQDRVQTPGENRVEMLKLALAGHAALEVCTYELDRGGVNYTVETLAQLREEDPTRELYFLMGADSLRDFYTWKEPARICQLATIVVVHRALNSDLALHSLIDAKSLERYLSADAIDAMLRHQVEMPRIDLSSSDIRRRVAQGQSIRYRTPAAVRMYIAAQGLYRTAEGL